MNYPYTRADRAIKYYISKGTMDYFGRISIPPEARLCE
jgi:hypothetical protein